jgi:Family of unknown function (DUF6526)
MANQEFSNHSRYIPLWHFVTSAIMLAILAGSVVNVWHSSPENLYSATLLVAVSVVLLLLFWYSRWFALRAQDRAIRAEENLRHFALTGKLLDNRLSIGQIIALRFASDEEFPALAKKAAEEKINGREIKQLVKNWRGDYHRV